MIAKITNRTTFYKAQVFQLAVLKSSRVECTLLYFHFVTFQFVLNSTSNKQRVTHETDWCVALQCRVNVCADLTCQL